METAFNYTAMEEKEAAELKSPNETNVIHHEERMEIK